MTPDEADETIRESSRSFRALRATARGKKVFLLGTGPSINDVDLSSLREEITITVNYFGNHDQVDALSPKFHILADPNFWNAGNTRNTFRSIIPSLSFLDRNPTRLLMPSWAASGSGGGAYRKWNPLYFQYGDGKLPIDFSGIIPTWGQNVLNIGFMFGLHLQASELVLIGFDNGGLLFSRDNGKVSFSFDNRRHFYPERIITDNSLADIDLDRCMYTHLQQLHGLRREAIRTGMAVFNCSRKGSFRMFPHLDLEDILERPQGRIQASNMTARRTTDSETVHGRILQQCESAPDRPAIHLLDDGKWRTVGRGEFAGKIHRYRKIFASRGNPGDLALFIKRTDIELLAAFIGAMACGRVPAQMSPPTSKVSLAEYQRRLEHIQATTKASILFLDSDADIPTSGWSGHVLAPDSLDSDDSDDSMRQANSVALAQFSSGSTGLQKAVLLDHAAILAHMESYSKAIGLTESDTMATWLPLYHDMGLIATYLMPLMEGVPVAIMDPFAWIADPSLLVDCAKRFSATVAFLPNFAFQVLADKCPGAGFESMRLFVNCSEPARAQTHRNFLSAFPKLSEKSLSVCYAMAENTFAVSQTEPGTPPRELEAGGKRMLSCGRIVDGVKVKIMDPDPDGIGEVAITGKNLYQRFLDGAERIIDGFYPTGDLGILDGGELFIAGRKKDLVIVNGKNIHPQDVEHATSSCNGVQPGRVVCFGIDNPATGSEDLVVLYEPKSVDKPQTNLAVGKAIQNETGILPRKVACVPKGSLVKTSSGKISRSRNKELFAQGHWKELIC